MRNITALAIFGTALLTPGCGDLLSLHPLYSEQDGVFGTTLEGRWESDDDLLFVDRADDAYEVTLQSKKNPSEQSKYEARLVDIGSIRFADLLSMDAVGHMFLKVRVAEGQLRIAFFDSEWLRQRIPHEESELAKGKKQAVLTARTPQLRKLVEQYASEPKAYEKEMVFHRPK